MDLTKVFHNEEIKVEIWFNMPIHMCTNTTCILVLAYTQCHACSHTHTHSYIYAVPPTFTTHPQAIVDAIECMLTHTHIYSHAVPPTFTTHPQATIDAIEWTEVILNCSASGTPLPTVRWEREGGTQLPVGAEPSPSTSGNIVRNINHADVHNI